MIESWRGLCDDLGADVEEREEVTQVAREEGELVHADDHHAVGARERLDARLDLLGGEVADRVLEVAVVGGQRRLELGVVEVEERALLGRAVLRRAGAVLLDRGLLKLGIALEAERLGEADDGRRGSRGAAGELLGGLEGGLVEVVDDVAGDVLLRAGELVEALGDERGKGLRFLLGLGPRRRPVAAGCGAGRRGGRAGLRRSLAHGGLIRPASRFPFRALAGDFVGEPRPRLRSVVGSRAWISRKRSAPSTAT